MIDPDRVSLRVERALIVFETRGGFGQNTTKYPDLPVNLRLQIENDVSLQADEVPIVASFPNHNRWLLLTSHRLVWNGEEEICSLQWEEIENASVPRSAISALGSSVKTENDKLELSTNKGKVQILVESGKPLIGFWNVLKMIGRMS